MSVVTGLAVGTLELVQVGAGKLGLDGGIWREGIDLSRLGYATAALFVLARACAAAVWRFARAAERWPTTLGQVKPDAHAPADQRPATTAVGSSG
jgi:hypothetical protein